MSHIHFSGSIYFSLVFLLFGCTKEIAVPQPPYTSRVSIQGIIETDSLPKVYFNRTVPYLTGSMYNADLVIRNASVVIKTSGEADDILQLDSTYDRIDCQYIYFYRGARPSKKDVPY